MVKIDEIFLNKVSQNLRFERNKNLAVLYYRLPMNFIRKDQSLSDHVVMEEIYLQDE